jgi:hypothetical protein
VRAALLVAALLAAAALAPAGVGAAGPGTATGISPSEAEVAAGETTTFTVTVADASEGIGALNATVSVGDTDAATVTGVSLAGDPGYSESGVGDDGESATLYAAWLGSPIEAGSDVTVATVTVEGAAAGETDLALDVHALGTAGGAQYEVTAEEGAGLSVTDGSDGGDGSDGSDPSPSLSVTDRSVSPTAGRAPLDVSAAATLANAGDAAGTRTVTLAVNGSVVGSKDVTVEASAEREVTFEHELGPGEHRVALAGGEPVTVDAAPNRAPTVSLAVSPNPPANAGTVTLEADASDPEGDDLTYRWDTDGDGSYDDATGASVEADLADGEHTVGVEVTDSRDGTATASRTFTVDTAAPTVSVGTATRADGTAVPEGSGALPVSGTLSVAGELADATTEPSATLVLDATFTNYEKRVDAAYDAEAGSFEASVAAADVADDGVYEVSVVASDAAGNTERTAIGRVGFDTAAPELAATVTPESATEGTVRVHSSEALRGAPSVSVTRPDGTSGPVSLTAASAPRTWTGTVDLEAEEPGAFDLTATGTDLAGNEGKTTASTAVKAGIDVSGGEATVAGANDTFVRLETESLVREANAYAAFTSQKQPTGALPPAVTGLSFLTGELSEELNDGLATATVGIPVEGTDLPDGVPPSAVEIRYFDADEGAWETVETNVTTRPGERETVERYWTANVSGFSTYGAVVPDRSAPSLSSASAPDVAAGAESLSVRFDYADAASGVDASAVTVAVNGPDRDGWDDVTDAGTTSVTGEFAALSVAKPGGGAYEVGVTVVDRAGNAVTFNRTAVVGTDDAAPELTGRSPDADTAIEAGSNVSLSLSLSDTVTGVDPEEVEVYFDGEEVTGDADVSASGVSYEVTEIAAGDRTLIVSAVDRAGNKERHEAVFEVAAPGGLGGGLGGGGLGGGGAPQTVSETEQPTAVSPTPTTPPEPTTTVAEPTATTAANGSEETEETSEPGEAERTDTGGAGGPADSPGTPGFTAATAVLAALLAAALARRV